MKQVYLLIIALLFPVSMWADDVTIPLYDISKGGTDAADQIAGSKDRRSLSFAPEASHDGHTVSIYSYVPMEEIQILVLDEGGNVMYEDTVAGNCSFTLGSQVKGELILLLETEDTVYKGTFYLE